MIGRQRVWSAGVALAAALLGAACAGETKKSPEEQAAEKCPQVHLDRMATDWVLATGDPKTRLRIVEDGDGYEMHYVAGFYTKIRLKGVKRGQDAQFTEVPSAAKQAFVDKGEARLTRLYVEPSYEACSLKVNRGFVDGDGKKEDVEPRPVEFLLFPPSDVVFTYRPADGPLFVGDAAHSAAKADKELAELGGPKADFEGNPVPVGVFTKVEDDGDPSCTYDMDLAFNDRMDKSLAKLPAGEVKDGKRHWFHEWDANYGGNNHFEMFRYRTCGGERALIGVSAIEATLH